MVNLLLRQGTDRPPIDLWNADIPIRMRRKEFVSRRRKLGAARWGRGPGRHLLAMICIRKLGGVSAGQMAAVWSGPVRSCLATALVLFDWNVSDLIHFEPRKQLCGICSPATLHLAAR